MRPRSSVRMDSGAVEIRLRIWLSAWVRPLRAEKRATRKTRMDSTFPPLVLASPVASPGPGGRDGVLRVGLALAPPALAVGAVDFDDADPLGLEMSGEPGAIGPGAFDTDQLDRARSRPATPAATCSRPRWWRSSRRRGELPVRPKLQLHGRRGAYRRRR